MLQSKTVPSTMTGMNSYYLTLVLKNDLDDGKRKALLDDVKKKALGAKGKIEKEDNWGGRDLAYPIKHQTKGYYIHLQFEVDPKSVKGLDKVLEVEEDILRYLLVRV